MRPTEQTPYDVLSKRLLSGERIVWSGRPKQGLLFSSRDVVLIPFSILWAGFAVFWNVLVWAQGAPTLFKLFGAPFLIVGIYITVGRLFHDAVVRRGQIYAVTNKRVLLLGRGGSTVRSIDIHRLPAVDLQEHADGSGSIAFGPVASPFAANSYRSMIPALDPTPRFIGIERASDVFQMIQKQATEG